ncbi:MAG: hypothetical protein HY690_09570 [Chloroflexi bacterium]|nr:hypothetical protein [Chloroflexota bacterium]
MFWQELLVTRWVGERELAAALGRVFGIPPQRVAVVDELEEIEARMRPDAHLLVQRTPLRGEFKAQLSVFVRDPEAERQVTALEPTLARVRALCAQLAVDCLLSDDSLSPLTSLRVRRDGTVERVTLDDDCLERDEYVVAEARALEESGGVATERPVHRSRAS